MKQHEILYHFFKLKKHREVCFCVSVQTDERLHVLGLYYIHVPNDKKLPANWVNRTRYFLPKSELKNLQVGGLGMPYMPAAEPPVKSLETVVPDSMGYEIHAALHRLKGEVGNINDYVRRYMGYASDNELANALSAEQVDAVALAVYNIEERHEGMITGDQTGIGKGRIAASLIRVYARMGLKPVFITEKPNLFSDIYRDLAAIGSANLIPFIVNGKESKTQVKDEDGNVVYEAYEKSLQESCFADGRVPAECDYVMATYSQFASNKPTTKQTFLQSIAADNVLILDESHNAGGNIDTSATARLFYDVVKDTRGVLFLSATFAKRPDNMPLYAAKTCMSETAMTNESLVEAISRGGVALQEVFSASLVNEGQMIRRERSFEGVEVNYISLNKDGHQDFGVEDLEKQHLGTADKITDILRDIIAFEGRYIKKAVGEMDKEVKAEMKEVKKRQGTSELGVSSTPYFSKIFMVINQMLFAIKAQAVAMRAIQRLQEGKKPVIAFASTMGAFLEGMENEHGNPIVDGDMINADFSEVLYRGLESLFAITEIDATGRRTKSRLTLASLPPEAHRDYETLLTRIRKISTGISISPIDNIKYYIEQAGYSVAEVTGRSMELQFQKSGSMAAMVKNRKKGILMPKHWTPSEKGQSTTRSVPLKFCRRAILGLSKGAVLNTDADVSFMMQYDGAFRIVTKSLSIEKFGWLVKNPKILPLVRENGGFQKTGSSWVGSVEAEDLEKAIDIIYLETGCNALLTSSQIDVIKQDIVRTEVKPKARIDEIVKAMPDNVMLVKPQVVTAVSDKERRLRIAKAKAQAKLKILALLNIQ